MAKERPNPYAAPKAVARSRRNEDDDDDDRGRYANFESARMSVVLAVALSAVTCGLYQSAWWFIRRRFVDSLDAPQKLGLALPIAAIATSVVAQTIRAAGKEFAPVGAILLLGGAILHLVTNFRIAGILRSHFGRNGIRRDISNLGTFFFGVLYLQYVINQGADAELSIPRDEPRKKKKRKKRRPVEEPVGDHAVEATAEESSPAAPTDAPAVEEPAEVDGEA